MDLFLSGGCKYYFLEPLVNQYYFLMKNNSLRQGYDQYTYGGFKVMGLTCDFFTCKQIFNL